MKNLILSLMLLMMTQYAVAELKVTDSWIKINPGNGRTAGAFMTINNIGGADITLIGVSSSVSGMAHFHAVEITDGMVSMVPLNDVVVPAKGSVQFKMGGLHIMLMGIKNKLNTGDLVNLKFELDDGRSITTAIQVAK